MKYVDLYNKNLEFCQRRPALKKALLIGNTFLPYLFVAFYALYLLVLVFNEQPVPEHFFYYFFGPACSFLVVSALRVFISRPRPYDTDGANITPLITKTKNGYCSCPSRHIACATSIALVFMAFSPAIGAFLLFATALLAYLRFAVGAHYPSDLLFGADISLFVHLVIITIL